MSIYNDIFEIVTPILQFYRSDLLIHDKAALQQNPGVPFLYRYSMAGTHFMFLWPTLREKRHDIGEFVRKVVKIYGSTDSWLFFDGLSLSSISKDDVTRIVEEYEHDES